jgi:hypothetical protein
VVTAFNSFSFPLEAPCLLPAILVVMRRFARIRSWGYNGRGGGAGLLGRRMNRATASHIENELDLTLEAAAATARQRKTKGSSSLKHK